MESLQHLCTTTAALREWARSRGAIDLHTAVLQAEDRVMQGVKDLVPMGRQRVIDKLVFDWMHDRAISQAQQGNAAAVAEPTTTSCA
jgi:hypothetical protein